MYSLALSAESDPTVAESDTAAASSDTDAPAADPAQEEPATETTQTEPAKEDTAPATETTSPSAVVETTDTATETSDTTATLSETPAVEPITTSETIAPAETPTESADATITTDIPSSEDILPATETAETPASEETTTSETPADATPTPADATSGASVEETLSTPTEPADETVCLSASVSGDSDTNWAIDEEKGVAETDEPVQLGVRYVYPLDKEVTVTFTCLPKDLSKRAPLSIERIKASDLQLPSGTVAASEYAYDITTEGMENGTFKYDLALPKSAMDGAEVKYIEQSADEVVEDKVTESELKSVDKDDVEESVDSVTVSDLDHFTVFVVTANQTISVAVSGVGTPDNGWVSDNNYATFNGQDDWAEYGFPDISVRGHYRWY